MSGPAGRSAVFLQLDITIYGDLQCFIIKSVLSNSLIRSGFKFDINFPYHVCSQRMNTKDPYA